MVINLFYVIELVQTRDHAIVYRESVDLEDNINFSCLNLQYVLDTFLPHYIPCLKQKQLGPKKRIPAPLQYQTSSKVKTKSFYSPVVNNASVTTLNIAS
ncbi:hypothetical protein Rin_00022510 [Candidatus Regiella insecticola 5.15]|uniref:Uncharacterized protein n=1 Tax=Candidatus Regiella insecticola 5.15 TaxID=1005043 RepID=G2H2F0_9ENTR|nr:hypothetical protein [Candidatus Regiella insecticola]EGY27829.1 hypothetical protein Rin_00022510 [Candidatus Regiella insecticola 5.15]